MFFFMEHGEFTIFTDMFGDFLMEILMGISWGFHEKPEDLLQFISDFHGTAWGFSWRFTNRHYMFVQTSDLKET